jgi:hypothetical protein
MDQVKVVLKSLKMLPDKLEMEVVYENVGKRTVFVMIDPVKVDGSKGPYAWISDEHSETLDVGVMLFPPPKYFLLANESRVKLQKLAAGDTHTEVFQVPFPFVATMPPYGEKPARRKIDPNRLQFVRASVGVLPDDEGLIDLLQRKPFGPFVSGLEELIQGPFKNQRIIALQRVYASARVRNNQLSGRRG